MGCLGCLVASGCLEWLLAAAGHSGDDYGVAATAKWVPVGAGGAHEATAVVVVVLAALHAYLHLISRLHHGA